jgi:hypothetical protein
MEKQKSSSAYIDYGEGFVSKSRFFDSPNCGRCIYKSSSTVEVNVPLTFGKETDIIKTSTGMLVIWQTLKD